MSEQKMREAMESEMDRFEAEISSLVKPPAMLPTSLMRRPPAPGTIPPPPKPTPVIISGAPQVYNARPRGPTQLTPTQLIPRHLRPPLIRGAPPITTATGQADGVPRLPTSIQARLAAVAATPMNVLISQQGASEPSTSTPSSSTTVTTGEDTAKPSTSSAANDTQKKGKKKKKKDEGDRKPRKHVRSAGGTVWEDPTLLDWDPKDFRLFCGDLGNDVTDEVLTRVFGRYPSFVKAKVIRDKRTNKTKGYGFVSFKDPADFVKAIRELDGRYVGSRPIKLRKSTWENRGLGQVRKREKQQKQLLGIIKPGQ